MDHKALFKISLDEDNFVQGLSIDIEDLYQAFKSRMDEENEIFPKILRVSEDDNLFIVSPSLPHNYEIIVRKKR